VEEDFVRINVVSGVRERVHGLRGDGLVIGMGVVIPVSTLYTEVDVVVDSGVRLVGR
jgi:hypothetical protein